MAKYHRLALCLIVIPVCLSAALLASEMPNTPLVTYETLVAGLEAPLVDLLRGTPPAGQDGTAALFGVSPDGRRVGYIDFADGKACMTVDGRQGAYYDAILAGTLIFSDDGRHIAYAAKQGGKSFVVLDGSPQKEYDAILEGTLAFSPDGARFAYGAKSGEKAFVVVDGKEQQAYGGILKGTVVFGQDSLQLAYAAKSGDHYLMVVNGREEDLYRGILESTIAFSPDCRRVAYGVKTGDKVRVVVDGRAGKEYDGILKGTPIFSPDGKHVAYGARAGNKTVVVLDGKEGPEYDMVARGLVFSADSRRLAYSVTNQGKSFVVVDGKQEPPCDAVREGSISFSPDGARLAYVAKAGAKECVVVDAKRGKEYDAVGPEGIVFSPDGRRLAYTAKSNGEWIAIVDGEEQGRYEYVSRPTFSTDGSQTAFTARRGQSELAVVDGREGARYDKIITYGGSIYYDAPLHHHYLALKDEGLYLISTYPPAEDGQGLEEAIAAMRNVRLESLDQMGKWSRLRAVENAWDVIKASGTAGYIRLRREITDACRAGTKDDFFLLNATALLWQLGRLSEAGTIAAVWKTVPLAEHYEFVFKTAFEAALTRDARAIPMLKACLGEAKGQVAIGEHDLRLMWPLTQQFQWGAFGPQGLPVLLHVLETSSDPVELQSAMLILTRAMYLPALPRIRKYATDGPADVRGTALICLGRFGHPADYALLTVNIRDDVPEDLRKYNILALGPYGDFRAVPIVAPLLGAESDQIRLSAILCLMDLVTPASLEILEEHGRKTKNEQEKELCNRHLQRVMGAFGFSWRDFSRKPNEEKQRLLKLFRDWEYELRPGERALTHAEFEEAMAAWRKSGSMSGSLCAWVEPRHVLPVANADDLERLLEVNAMFYSRLSDECLGETAKIDSIVERIGRSRYRKDPGPTEKVEAIS